MTMYALYRRKSPEQTKLRYPSKYKTNALPPHLIQLSDIDAQVYFYSTF